MFEQLSDRLQGTIKKLRGQARLSEDNITDAMREVRIALLEADVSLAVVKEFVAKVKEKALGTEVLKSLNPGQMLIKVVNDELVSMMGEENDALDLAQRPPAVILMAGLQGAGKTTTVAKLANMLKARDGKRVMVVSADVYRPAAIEQLQTLASSIDVEWCESSVKDKPVKIVKKAIKQAQNKVMDVLIIDTAGRLHVDNELMKEIQEVHQAANPIETLFVVDSMTGQDAVNSAKAFDEALPLTGVVLTKTDGDARGGAALSIRQVTGKPIKFLGVGEKIDGIEAFHPDRVASRILGMGDVMTLIEEAGQNIDKEKAEKLAKKLKKGKGFDLEDYRDQIQQMEKMGGIESLMDKLPGMGNMNIPQGALSIGSELARQLASVCSSHLILFDQSEYNLYRIEEELSEQFPDLSLTPILGDICDKAAMQNIFKTYKPSAVFHAAAYKHVPLLEGQVREAVKNNVLGTKIVADLSREYNTEKFVLISTDKAVNPSSLMGACKRIAEIYCQMLASSTKTNYITVRFGNVLGSAGSVVPKFQKQIRAGGPVTVTDPKMTRYFMTITEASQLILEASAVGKDGRIYVLDMGKPVLIVDLANQLIRLSGKTPEKDIKVVFTGLRAGEKLYEELFHDDENLTDTNHEKILLAATRQVDDKLVVKVFNEFLDSVNNNNNDNDGISANIKQLVPEYGCKSKPVSEKKRA